MLTRGSGFAPASRWWLGGPATQGGEEKRVRGQVRVDTPSMLTPHHKKREKKANRPSSALQTTTKNLVSLKRTQMRGFLRITQANALCLPLITIS